MEMSTERSAGYVRTSRAPINVMRRESVQPRGEYADDARLAKVLELQRSIQNGDYVIDAFLLADRLVGDMLKQ